MESIAKSSCGKSSTNNCELAGSNMKAITFCIIVNISSTRPTLPIAMINEEKG